MNGTGDTLSGRERMMARILKWAPWLSFFLVALPFPLFFLALYSVSTAIETAAIYIFAALFSLAIGSIAGLGVMIFLLLYRKRWFKRLRDKMAADGITVLSDLAASGEYRKHLVTVYAKRAMERAIERARA